MNDRRSVALDRVVDGHVHVWHPLDEGGEWLERAVPSLQREHTIEEFRRAASAVTVESVVLVEAAASLTTTAKLLGIAHEVAPFAVVVGWLDAASATVDDDVAALRMLDGGDHLAGVRYSPPGAARAGWLESDALSRSLEVFGRARLSFDLLLTSADLDAAARLCRRHPSVSFVVDHLGGLPDESEGGVQAWRNGIAAIAACENAVVKLSGRILRETRPDAAALVAHAIDVFGPHRMLFGSDWPISSTTDDYAARVGRAIELAGPLSDAELDAVFAGTAARAYRAPSVAAAPAGSTA
ncbi:amidohydrolase family protein [Agromyces ramosus]|uniref:L-fuconolactonase n=1 Tax=Agromyces ramosus TaxID=33879 RepID=A0ABU0RBL0_9MICO|nr:amidohydrolase family protein [Agromyces ramosus]MDQ0895147.1 L-fuconolactonase [Agromyces ramosus]